MKAKEVAPLPALPACQAARHGFLLHASSGPRTAARWMSTQHLIIRSAYLTCRMTSSAGPAVHAVVRLEPRSTGLADLADPIATDD